MLCSSKPIGKINHNIKTLNQEKGKTTGKRGQKIKKTNRKTIAKWQA